jgi:hypothetical protein
MVALGHKLTDARDRENNIRKAIVFELRPLDVVNAMLDEEPVATGDLGALRERACSAADL